MFEMSISKYDCFLCLKYLYIINVICSSQRGCNSGAEWSLCMRQVAGSIPASSTILQCTFWVAKHCTFCSAKNSANAIEFRDMLQQSLFQFCFLHCPFRTLRTWWLIPQKVLQWMIFSSFIRVIGRLFPPDRARPTPFCVVYTCRIRRMKR